MTPEQEQFLRDLQEAIQGLPMEDRRTAYASFVDGNPEAEALLSRMRFAWQGRVQVEWTDYGGYAYRPRQIIAKGEEAQTFAGNLLSREANQWRFLPDTVEHALLRLADTDEFQELVGDRLDEFRQRSQQVREFFTELGFGDLNHWATLDDVEDVAATVRAARAAGHKVQPNHVLFADSCGCGEQCPPHPSLANDLSGLFGDPLRANPLRANPLRANPLRANPLRANPLRANPLRANEPPLNEAAPAEKPEHTASQLPNAGAARVVIFDTGHATGAYRPDVLGTADIGGYPEVPDSIDPTDQYLDPVAGHGTFIAGMLQMLSPDTPQFIWKAIEPTGDAEELTLVSLISLQLFLDKFLDNTDAWPLTIFSMSLSGYFVSEEVLLAEAIADVLTKDIVVVASAGNLSSCRPAFPAAYPGVIGVGSLSPCGPAEFTSYGDWVDACAPGVDLISAFFKFDGENVPINGVDVDAFDGWAYWSGTSFSVPIVVSALVNHMRLQQSSASDAVKSVIEAPQLARVQCLGTIINPPNLPLERPDDSDFTGWVPPATTVGDDWQQNPVDWANLARPNS